MSTVTISVKVKDYDQNGINVFELNGAARKKITANAGDTIVFDQSDSSNVGHPLVIALYKDGHHNIEGNEYTIGVTKNGTPGQAGANTTFILNNQTLNGTYYYYCQNHPGMGGTIHFGGTTIIDEGATADDAQDGDLTDKITKTILEYNPDTGFFDITVLSQTDPNTNPHANPWKAIGTDSTKFTRYKILYNVKDSSNVLAAQKVKTFNLITTNLDLPDEPEPDEFVSTDTNSLYEWETTHDYTIGYTNGHRIRVNWYSDDYSIPGHGAINSDFWGMDYTSDRAVFLLLIWNRETQYHDDGFTRVSMDKRYTSSRGIDLLMPFGIYKPMDETIYNKVLHGLPASGPNLGHRNPSVDRDAYLYDTPLIDSNGNSLGNVSYGENALLGDYFCKSWAGFDIDLWCHGTEMVPGLRIKDDTHNIVGHMPDPKTDPFGGRHIFGSHSLHETGEYSEDDAYGANTQLNPPDYDGYILDGYMYYKGSLKANWDNGGRNDTQLVDDNTNLKIASRPTQSNFGARLRYTVARKPLSSDQTPQTVADALKERRSYRTASNVLSGWYRNPHDYFHDTVIRRFQSGENFFPEGSPNFGINFSGIDQEGPYFLKHEILEMYPYFRNFTIGST